MTIFRGDWIMMTAYRNLRRRALAMVTLWTVALWWGGLTFYSAVVVPEGAERFGSSEQGMVTQEVTRVLNGLGLMAAILAGGQAFLQRRKGLLAAAIVLMVATLGLMGLHGYMSRMIDPTHGVVVDSDAFYNWHRVYLLGTALQWGGGVVGVALLSGGTASGVRQNENRQGKC